MKKTRDGTILRSRKEQKRYHAYTTKYKVADCDFCNYNDSMNQIIEAHDNFLVIKNLFPYAIWDGVNVLNHMMLIPKRHVTSMSEFSEDESLEHTKLLGYYEDLGYSTYARSNRNNMKTVPHQHTHLIKTGTKQKKLLVFIRRPHVLIAR